MTDRELHHVGDRRTWALSLLLLLLVGVAAVGLKLADSSSPDPRGHSRSAMPSAVAGAQGREAVTVALRAGVHAANALGGRSSAAVWIEGWPGPVAAGTTVTAYTRLWSLAKPVAAIAAYRAWEARRGPLGATLVAAADDAITRSDNCGERYLVLELNALTGGPGPGRRAFEAVLLQAGVHVASRALPEPVQEAATCALYLARRAPIANPNAAGWQFGIDEWGVTQAVAFVHALVTHAYGRAGDAVVNAMRRPKQPELTTLEVPTGNHIPDLQWGAGDAFASWRPAYKAGWGGSHQRDFLAAQIVALPDASPPVALAAVFRPNAQPRTDDIGETRAPEALRVLFASVARELRRDRVIR